MYRRSWPAVIITLILIGAMLLGFGVMIAYYIDIVQALVLMLIGLVFMAGGIGILRWYRKKKKETGKDSDMNG